MFRRLTANPRAVFAVVYLVAVVVRLPIAAGILQDPQRAIADDSHRYWTLADNMRRHQSFGLAEEEFPWVEFRAIQEANGTAPKADARGLVPDGLRTPGYPAFVAVCRTVWDSPASVILAQVLLAGLTACVLASTAWRFSGSPRAALLAGLLWGLHPALIVADGFVLTEPVFSLGVALTFWLGARSKRPRGLLLMGLVAGLTALVRPFGVLLIWPVLVFALARADRRWLTAIGAAVLAVLPPGLWTMRNAQQGHGHRLCVVGDLTMYYYFGHYVHCEQEGLDWYESWRPAFPGRTAALAKRVKPGDDCYTVAGAMAREELLADPKSTANVLVKSQFKLWVAHSMGDAYRVCGQTYRPSGLLSALMGEAGGGGLSAASVAGLAWSLWNLVLVGWTLVGAVRAVRRWQWVLFLTAAGLIALAAAGTMCVGQERFRLPILVPMILLVTGRGRDTAVTR